MKPTLGRIVHVWLDGEPFAAIVTDVYGDSGVIDAVVFDRHRKAEVTEVFRDLAPSGSRERDGWCWPPRDGGAA